MDMELRGTDRVEKAENIERRINTLLFVFYVIL